MHGELVALQERQPTFLQQRRSKMQQLVRCQVSGSFYTADRERECDCMGCIAQQMYVYRTAPFPMAGAVGFRLCQGRFLPKSPTEKLRLASLPHFACSSSAFCSTELIHERNATDPKLTCTALVHVRMGIATTDRTSMIHMSVFSVAQQSQQDRTRIETVYRLASVTDFNFLGIEISVDAQYVRGQRKYIRRHRLRNSYLG